MFCLPLIVYLELIILTEGELVKERQNGALRQSERCLPTMEESIGRIYEIEVVAVFAVAARSQRRNEDGAILSYRGEIKLFFRVAFSSPRARDSPCGPTNESSSGADNLMKAGN